MALVNPHPALKAAVPMSPMVDGWMGDDWFHNGAFRQVNLDYFTEPDHGARRRRQHRRAAATTTTTTSCAPARPATSRKAAGLDQLPCWRKLIEHPAYDSFWQEQALDKHAGDAAADGADDAGSQGLWDQEDM